MVQRSILGSLLWLSGMLCMGSADRMDRLKMQADRIEQIRMQRAHCAALIKIRVQLEKEMATFDQQTRRFAYEVDEMDDYVHVVGQFNRQKWEHFRMWYSAHLDREQLFVQNRNSGDDLEKMYSILKPNEAFLFHVLSVVQPCNCRIAKMFYKKLDCMTDQELSRKFPDIAQQKKEGGQSDLFFKQLIEDGCFPGAIMLPEHQ